MPVITPTGVILGLFLGSSFVQLKPLVTYLFAFITFTGALGMVFSDFKYVYKHPLVVLISLFCSHVLMPSLVFLFGSLIFPSSPSIVIGFVLLYSIPTAVVSYIWSGIYKGNGVLSLALVLLGTILSPLLTPLSVKLLSGTNIEIKTAGMMLSLCYMVVLPCILGVSINTATKGWAKKEVAPYLKPFTKVCLLFVIIINTSQIRGKLNLSWSLIGILGINLVFSIGGLLLGYFISTLFKYSKEDRTSLTYSVGLRNISAALVLAIDYFPAETSVPVLLGITTQQIIAALSGKVLFGRKQKEAIIENIK